MQWTHPELDLTGTIVDLGIIPRVGVPLLLAVSQIQDRGLRAFLVSAILQSEPHRYAAHLGQAGTFFCEAGGRVLRAALHARAYSLISPHARTDHYQEALTGIVLGSLSPGAAGDRSRPDAPATHRWLKEHARAQRSRLAHWGCTRAQLRQVISLSAVAAGSTRERASLAGIGPRTEVRIALANYAADAAIHGPTQSAHTVPLPRWMQPGMPQRQAGLLLLEQIERGMTSEQWHARTPAA